MEEEEEELLVVVVAEQAAVRLGPWEAHLCRWVERAGLRALALVSGLEAVRMEVRLCGPLGEG